MRIAIVDDEKNFLSNLKNIIIESYPEPDKLNISEFGCGEEFIKDFKKSMYDVIILDIEMKELNGLETAEKIRSADNSVIIVFLTSHQEFALQGYEVNAFRYMLKNRCIGGS
ncbi:MAG: response regulator [Clostridium sp.]|nr:response regulator [Clostridium sp.]